MPDLSFLPQNTLLLVLIVVVSTQFLKEQFGLDGRKALLLSFGLGVLVAFGGMRRTALLVFPDWPEWAGCLGLGFFLGLWASGGYKLLTWLQDRGADARARAQAEVGMVAGPAVGSTPASLPPVAEMTSDTPPGFRPATSADLEQAAAQALPLLPATMAQPIE